MENIKRETSIDIIRGFAILFVVLGHTITGCLVDYESNLLFNIIWTLQMPLFFMISGFLNKYNTKTDSFIKLLKRILLKTLSYLWPYLVWTFFIKGLLFNERNMFNISYLMYHIDTGYWFLFTLWLITVVIEISNYFSFRMSKSYNGVKYFLSNIMINFLFYVFFYILGRCFSFSFLGIKYFLYYIVFYLLAVYYGKLTLCIDKTKKFTKSLEIICIITSFIYFYIILRFDIFLFDDSVKHILIRFIVSICGTISFCYFTNLIFFNINNCFKRLLLYFGQHSLEIYLVHGFFLTLLSTNACYKITDFGGFSLLLLNYSLTLLCCALFTKCCEHSIFIRLILFGKKFKKDEQHLEKTV